MRQTFLAIVVPLLVLAACSTSDATVTTLSTAPPTTSDEPSIGGDAPGSVPPTTSNEPSIGGDAPGSLTGALGSTPGVTRSMVNCVATDLGNRLTTNQIQALVASNGDISALPAETQELVVGSVTYCIPVTVFAQAIGEHLASGARLTASQRECLSSEILGIIPPEELVRLGMAGATQPPPVFDDELRRAVETCGVVVAGNGS